MSEKERLDRIEQRLAKLESSLDASKVASDKYAQLALVTTEMKKVLEILERTLKSQ